MLVTRILLRLSFAEIALLTVTVFGLSPIDHPPIASAQTASLIDCEEFVDRAEAQRFFEEEGGPTRDLYELDRDGDGIACEPELEPTPISQSHAEACEGFQDYLAEPEADDDTRERFEEECADYLEQTGQMRLCPAYQGLSFRYFSTLTQGQSDDLTDAQRREYESVMGYTEGECVPVDVALTLAWQCQELTFYLMEFSPFRDVQMTSFSYFKDEITERYQVVCLGAEVDDGPRKFSTKYLIGAAVAGAGAVYLYGRYRKNQASAAQE